MEQSSFARIVGVLTSPTQTFRAIAGKPTWVVPLAVLIGLGVVTGALMNGKIDWGEITRDSIEARGQDIPEDQLEGIVDFQEKAGPIFMIGGSLVAQPVLLLLLALVLMVVFKVLGGEIDFKRTFSVLLHGLMPRAVMALLSIPIILGKDEFGFEELQDGSVLTSNLGSFAGEDASAAMVALLSSFDVFTIWAIVLLIIGFATVAKVSKAVSAAGVVGLWIVLILIKVGLSALGS